MAPKQAYLVCYDYGMGGLWGFLAAESEDAIRERYPELIVVKERPKFLRSKERWQRLVARSSYDIDEEPRGLLRALLADRAKSN
jgi:hypothetical protein